MKKQVFLIAALLFSGVCFSSLRDNSVKACCQHAAGGCGVMKKKSMYKAPAAGISDNDGALNMFMNPFQQF